MSLSGMEEGGGRRRHIPGGIVQKGGRLTAALKTERSFVKGRALL
jgi:hypothetical protein